MQEWVLTIIIYSVFIKAILDLFSESTSSSGEKDIDFPGYLGNCIKDEVPRCGN